MSICCLRQWHCAILFVVAITGIVSADESIPAKVHLVTICDTDNKEPIFARDVARDEVLVRAALMSGLPAGMLEVYRVVGADFSVTKARNVIQSMVVSPNDCILVYYSGHGAFDQPRGHFLDFYSPKDKDDNRPADHFLRATLLSDLEIKGARLVVVLTDSCAAYKPAIKPRPEEAPVDLDAIVRPAVPLPSMRSLFLVPKGRVDVNSCKEGEVSMTRGDGSGSVFTFRFAMLLREHASRELDWALILPVLDDICRKDFQKLWPDGRDFMDLRGVRQYQKSQSVRVFTVIGMAFGVRAKEDGGKLQVTQVLAGSPGAKAGLETHDVILRLNGQSIGSETEFTQAIDQSPAEMIVEYQRGNQAPKTATVSLNRQSK